MLIEKKIQFQAIDLQRAFLLHHRVTIPVRSRILLLIGVVLLIISIVFFFIDPEPSSNFFLIFLFCYSILVVIIHFIMMNTIGKRMYKKLIDFHKPYVFILTDDKMQVTGPKQQGFQEWTAYHKLIYNDQISLLYINDLFFHILPARFFSSEEWDNLIKKISPLIPLVKNRTSKKS